MTQDSDYSDDPLISMQQETAARDLNRFYNTLSSPDQSHINWQIRGFRHYLVQVMQCVTLRDLRRRAIGRRQKDD